MSSPDKCCASIHAGPSSVWGSIGRYRCGRTAKVTRDGKPYCGVHDPERLATIRARNDAAARERAAAERDRRVAAALRDATVDELRAELARREEHDV